MEESISDVIVPHTGYKKGWNLIVYNDNHSELNTVIETFIGSGIVPPTEEGVEQASALTMAIHQNGYHAIPFGKHKEVVYTLEKVFKSAGIQVEAFYEETETATPPKSRPIGFMRDDESKDA